MRRAMYTAAGCVLAVQAFQACAAMLEVEPIPVEAEAPAKTSILELSNRATTPAVLQIRIFRWTQERGDDQLAPTEDVVLSPPIASIAPGAKQVVRLIRVTDTPVQAEEAYRVLVDELPSSEQEAPSQQTSVRILTRYSMPVFYTPPAAVTAPARLQWALMQRPDGSWDLSAHNSGGRRERVTDLSLHAGAARSAAPFGDNALVGYVLSGQTRHWPVKLPQDFAAGGTMQIQYQNDAGPVRGAVTVESGH